MQASARRPLDRRIGVTLVLQRQISELEGEKRLRFHRVVADFLTGSRSAPGSICMTIHFSPTRQSQALAGLSPWAVAAQGSGNVPTRGRQYPARQRAGPASTPRMRHTGQLRQFALAAPASARYGSRAGTFASAQAITSASRQPVRKTTVEASTGAPAAERRIWWRISISLSGQPLPASASRSAQKIPPASSRPASQPRLVGRHRAAPGGNSGAAATVWGFENHFDPRASACGVG